MSLPDGMLEEPADDEWCQEHFTSKPCAACRADAADRQYDSRREDRDE
jgi:hypothetical protein